MTISRLVVLDSSFDGGMGHHRLLNQNLLSLAAAQGWEQVLLCSSGFDDLDGFPPTVDIRPLVSHGIYHRYGAHGVDRVLGFNRRALDNLRGLPEELFDGSTALYVHTTSEVEVLALSVWLDELAALGVRSVLGMMFPPFTRDIGSLTEPTASLLAASVYRRALERLAKNPMVSIGAYGPCLTETFSAFVGAAVHSLPAPILPLIPASTIERPAGDSMIPEGAILLYAGDGRNDKGLHLTAAIARELLQSNVPQPIAVQVSGTYAEQHNVVLDELVRLARSTDLVLVNGRLDPGQYNEMWRNISLMCCFYDSREYRYKTSGVGWETMEYGVPAVLAPALWHEGEYTHYGHPFVTADAYWPDDLADAVVRAANKLPELTAQAQESRSRFLAENSVQSLVAPLLQQSMPADGSAMPEPPPLPLYGNYVDAFVASGF